MPTWEVPGGQLYDVEFRKLCMENHTLSTQELVALGHQDKTSAKKTACIVHEVKFRFWLVDNKDPDNFD